MQSALAKFLLSNYLIKGVAYLSQLLLIYFLTIEEIGYVRISLSYLEILNVVCGFGLTTALLKINATPGVSRSKQKENLLFSFVTTILFTSAVVFITTMVINHTDIISSVEVKELTKYLLFSLFLSGVTNLLVIDYQVNNMFTRLAKTQLLAKIVTVITLPAMIYYLNINGYVLNVFFGFLFSIIAMLYYGEYKIRLKITKLKSSIESYIIFIKENINLSIYALLSNFVGIFNKYSSIYIIAYIGTEDKEFGMYSISLTLFVLLEIVTTTLQQYYTPKFSNKSHSYTGWIELFYRTQKRSILLQAIIWVIVNVLLFSVIYFIFSSYLKVFEYFILISLSWFISSFYTMKGPALISLGLTKYNFYSALIAMPIVFLSSFSLVYQFAILGVAISKICQCLISCLVTNLFFYKAKNRFKECKEVQDV